MKCGKHYEEIKKVMFALFSQGLLGVMTFFTNLVLPGYMGPEEYGYLQKFMFYLSYLNMFALGFNDGITLNYAGKGQEDLPYERIRRGIRIIMLYACGVMLALAAWAIRQGESYERYIWLMLSMNLGITFLVCIGNGICLAINKSVFYNTINLLQRFVFCVGICMLWAGKACTAKKAILVDTLSFFLVACVYLVSEKRFFWGKASGWRDGIHEVKQLCVSGLAIALSVTLMGLVPAFGRVIVEKAESIRVYGIYSFYVSVLSIILTFTNAIGTVAFPMFKKYDKENLDKYYTTLSCLYQLVGTVVNYVYIPLYFIIKFFMPEYYENITWLIVLLPLCYPLGKTQVLLVPVYKAYRMENKLLKINLVVFLLIVVTTVLGYTFTNSVFVVAVITACITAIYNKILEQYLYHINTAIEKKANWIDLLTPIVFALCALQGSMGKFAICYSIYTLIVILYIGSKGRRNGKNTFFDNTISEAK